MNRAETAVRRIDRFQQRHAILAVPFAVVQKFGNDQAGGKATIIAFYALFAVFPLLLLFSTILGFVLAGHPDLEQRMINSALADFPILGTQLRSSTHPLRGNGLALVLGVLGALYGAQGIGQAAQNAMNTVWNVPFKDWPGFVGRRIRGLTILMLLGIGVLASTTLIGFAPRFGPLSAAWASAAAAGVNFLVFLVCFTVLTSATVRVRDVAIGAVVATVFWEILQRIGDWFVRYTISHSTDVYGFFAIVLGLLSWLYLGARLTLLAAEINVVVRYRLWPRSMTQPPFTPQDKTAMVLLAKMEERRPEETVDVNFTPEADRQPLDEPSQTPGPHDGGEPLPEHPPEHETGSPERAV